jgi:hypothetical protein
MPVSIRPFSGYVPFPITLDARRYVYWLRGELLRLRAAYACFALRALFGCCCLRASILQRALVKCTVFVRLVCRSSYSYPFACFRLSAASRLLGYVRCRRSLFAIYVSLLRRVP